jgi:DNA primase
MSKALSDKIKPINLPDIASSAGVELHSRGGDHVGLCPFHSEKTPSFKINQDPSGKWRFYCFGCHEKGDALDFVQMRYGLDMKAALSFLGIESRPAAARIRPAEVRKIKQKRDLRAAFDRWQDAARHTYAFLYRATRKAMIDLSPAEFDELGAILHPLPTWEYYLDILTFGTDADCWALFQDQLKSRPPLLERGRLFNETFNLKKYLSGAS